ncbi:MAG: sigma-54-dependent Fis family transcriptional regulator [Ignavibacteriales bacterium]|nr:sigma-54-dependent Fis family transcriptional regulator [Ignavibacteriales bacterium]
MEKNKKIKVLIADDEVLLTNSLKSILVRYGYEVAVCYSGAEVFPMMEHFQPDMVLLDIFLGDMNGIELMKRLHEEQGDLPVVMITANSDVNMAVRAMKEGALDYVVKPFDLDILHSIIQKAIDTASVRSSFRPKLALKKSSFLSSVIAESDEMKNVMKTVQHFAMSTSTTVLVQGESGTGKELVSRAIHHTSSRCNGPFISINCGAIPRDLAESEFFGYEKGAFTGASEKLKQGKFELAHTGTLLLDEIGELSLDMQVKLLRVLEEKRFYRLGGTKEIEVDVRVIASSNRDLMNEVEQHRFREDLYYRLNVATITIPPLRERIKDILPLAEKCLEEFSEKFRKQKFTLSSEAKIFLQQYSWRGNVRELRNSLERIVLLNEPCEIIVSQFSFMKSPQNGFNNFSPSSNGRTETSPAKLFVENGLSGDAAKRDVIIKTLAETGGNLVKAAKLLGLTRSQLRYRVEQLGIKVSKLKQK